MNASDGAAMNTEATQKRNPTEQVIDTLSNVYTRDMPEEQRLLYRSALQSLVKLAKAELLLEMQLDFNKCTGVGL
jgi:hypothetical protein